MLPLSFDPQVNRERISDLIGHLRSREVVFFAGAALSLTSDLPLAFEIKMTVLELISRRLSTPNYQSPVQFGMRHRQKLEDMPLEVMFQFIANTLGDYAVEALTPLDTDPRIERFNHNHLFLALAAGNLFSTILTTNFDHLIEDAFDSLNKAHKALAYDNEMDDPGRVIAGTGATIAKFHGSIDRLNSIIVTMEQAGSGLPPNKAKLLSECLSKYYVCFVGYGLGDFDVYSTIGGASCRGVYALLRPPRHGETTETYVERNVRIIDVLKQVGGIPIVYDIDQFFDALCTSLFPHEHRTHVSVGSQKGPGPSLKSQLQQWASRIATIDAYCILGALYYHMGDGEFSKDVYQTAIDLGIATTEKEDLRLVLGRGYAHARTGDYQRYFEDAERALKIAKGLRSQFDIAEALFHSGDALRIRAGGLSLRGFVRLKRAERLYASLSGKAARHGRGSALLALGLMFRDLCPTWPVLRPIHRRILGLLQRAYTLLAGPNGNALRVIASLLGRMGENVTGLELSAQAELICRWHHDDVGLANTLRTVAEIQRSEGNTGAAKTCYKEALRASRRAQDRPGVAKSLLGLAELSKASGGVGRARRLYLLAWQWIKGTGLVNFGMGLLLRTLFGISWCNLAIRLSRRGAT